MLFKLNTCVSHINACGKNNPQINPLIMKEFQTMTIALANATAWCASKVPIVEHIDANIKGIVLGICNAILASDCFGRPVEIFAEAHGNQDVDEFTIITSTDAKLIFFEYNVNLTIENFNADLLALVQRMKSIRAIMTAYIVRVENPVAAGLAFECSFIAFAICADKLMKALNAIVAEPESV